MENINISNHPDLDLSTIKREFQFKEIATDLKDYAKIKGVIYCKNSKGETPNVFNVNGYYYELMADKTTLVNSETGAYSLEGNTTEIDFIKDMSVSLIAQGLNKNIEDLKVIDIMEYLVVASVIKQDAYKRFDK